MVVELLETGSKRVVEGAPRWAGNHRIAAEQASWELAPVVVADSLQLEHRDCAVGTIVEGHKDLQMERLLEEPVHSLADQPLALHKREPEELAQRLIAGICSLSRLAGESGSWAAAGNLM